MLAPPPASLHIEGAAHETRIFLDHGSPRSPMVPWKRLAIGLWIGGMVLSWFLPFLLCPVAVVATGLVGFVLLADARRTEVHRISLRPRHMTILRRGWSGLTREEVAYADLESADLASKQGGRGRDAVLLKWRCEGEVRSVRVGTGRDPAELSWLHEALQLLVERTRAAHGAIEDAIEEGLDEEAAGAPEPAVEGLPRP